MKDRVFRSPHLKGQKFTFNAEVAAVFDDMVSRSIPFYREIHQVLIDILRLRFPLQHQQRTIYDLGCSTATTLYLVAQWLHQQNVHPPLIGVDNSPAMITQAEAKIKQLHLSNIQLHCADVRQMPLEKSALVMMNYTLQFIPMGHRAPLLAKINRALVTNGIFFYAEKIKCQNKTIDPLFTQLYYDFKRRNGYSDLEIARKREALEKVLVPLTCEKHLLLLREAGFKKTDILFRWYNFACFLAIK